LDTGPDPAFEVEAPHDHDEIRSLLAAPPQGTEAPTIDAIEHTLTAGYAKALALGRALAARAPDRAGRRAARWQVARRRAFELTQLGQRLSSATATSTTFAASLLAAQRATRSGNRPGT